MPVDPQFVGLVQILLGAVSLFFLKPAYENREGPGSLSFAALCVGVGIYGFSAGLDRFVYGYGPSLFVFTFRSFGGVLITSAWLLLALDMTDRVTVTRRMRAAVAGYTLLAQLFIWTAPAHTLVVGPGTVIEGANFEPEIGVGLWAILGIGYLATLVGTGLLAADAVRSTGIRRRQLTVLSLAIVPTLLGSLLTVSGVARYDYTPVGYALTAFMFGWALYSSRFLDLTPVARRTALGEMSDAVVTLDDGDRVVDCNQRARDLFDAGDDYAGTPAETFFPPAVAERLAVGNPAETETEIAVRLDDRERHFSLSVSPVTRRSHRGRVVVLRDITDRKRREQELQRQNERLDRLTGMVSHDLRNPLTVADGQASLAARKAESAAVTDHLDTVQQSHERMEAMVEDLLLLARSGRRVEERESVALASLVRDAWAYAEVGDCELDLAVPEDVRVSADPDRLLHVFENCFRNAREHGAANADTEGGPDAADHDAAPLSVRVGLLDAGDGRADFFIEDDGAGIPPDERDDVFEHGYTTDDSGTGLGLSICKDIVDAHGWSIRVTESDSGGARFEVTGVEPADG
jgi:PAS domain S-box-containing protein